MQKTSSPSTTYCLRREERDKEVIAIKEGEREGCGMSREGG